jgi:hypothetical protein
MWEGMAFRLNHCGPLTSSPSRTTSTLAVDGVDHLTARSRRRIPAGRSPELAKNVRDLFAAAHPRPADPAVLRSSCVRSYDCATHIRASCFVAFS